MRFRFLKPFDIDDAGVFFLGTLRPKGSGRFVVEEQGGPRRAIYRGDFDYVRGSPRGEVDSLTVKRGSTTLFKVLDVGRDAQTFLNKLAQAFRVQSREPFTDWLLRGRDDAQGSSGPDSFEGGSGNDTARGGSGSDRILGGDGDDSVEGGPGNDQLGGGDGDDTLIGGRGADLLYGGPGNDLIICDIRDGDDFAGPSGGKGRDTLSFAGSGKGVDIDRGVNLDELLISDVRPNNHDVYMRARDFEIVIGSAHDDIIGGAGLAQAHGGAGDDRVGARRKATGGTGDDEVSVGSGGIAKGGPGDDVVSGGGWFDSPRGAKLYGQSGHDRVQGNKSDDTLYGGPGRDTLSGDEGDDELFGGGGADHLQGGRGNDDLYGGKGPDVLVGGWGRHELNGGPGADVFNFRIHRTLPSDTGQQRHRIPDFGDGVDHILITDVHRIFGRDPIGFSDLEIKARDDDVVVKIAYLRLVVADMDLDSFNEADFQFETDWS